MSEPAAAEVPPHTNGVPEDADDDERGKMRPADIDADMKEMEKRKRVEMIMGSRLFREELERIIDSQMKDGGGPAGLLQQIQDMVGGASRLHAGTMFRNSSCVTPINDIRGVESMGYAKGEKVLRCKLASVFRLMDLYGWTHGIHNHITARLNQEQEHFLVNPFGMLYHEITASSLVKVDMQGSVVEQGTTNFGVDTSKFQLHGAVHAARPDVKCVIHIHTPSVVAISSLKAGLLPLGREAAVLGEVSTHRFFGGVTEPEERDKIARSLGPINKVLLLSNAGALCCGETVEEAFYNVYNTVLACETQVKLMPMGIDNLETLPDEARKAMYDAARKAPDGALPKNATPLPPALEKKEKKWRIGGMEFEALMRMLDNAGFRTGYIYRTPLVKGEPPKPRNDVEVPPAVSSLGYLLEEEEMYNKGQWKKGAYSKNDRTRWLNSPNVYQKVEILETGTTDPKKITKWVDANNQEEWVADGSPTHTSTPVKIDAALQFVPKNTNPKEFKKLQQQIKENRRADKITSGPQSHILEGVTWEEAKKLQDATISMTGDHVIQIGAASKGIIQRGFQHNATVYKTPYAKNPFDCVSDAELEDYKKVVIRKQRGDYYDEDASESEPLSSSAALPPDVKSPPSETEDDSRTEPRVLRIETKTAPVPSQAEVVLSDVEQIDALLDQVEHDLPDPHVERSKSHRFPPVEDKSKDKGKRSASASRPPKPPPRAGRDTGPNSNEPVKLKVRLVSVKELQRWKKRPSPIQEEVEEGEKQDKEIGEKFLSFSKFGGSSGLGKVDSSHDGSAKGRGDSKEQIGLPQKAVINKRKWNPDLGMDGGDEGWIKKQTLERSQTVFDFSEWMNRENIWSQTTRVNESPKISSGSQTEYSLGNVGLQSTSLVHCPCCRKNVETKEISTQTKLRMWVDDSENDVDDGMSIPVPPPMPSIASPHQSGNILISPAPAHRKTPHEEETERRRSLMFAIHRELTMKFESSSDKKIKEEPAPTILMDDVEEVSISICSRSHIDNKEIDIETTKTGFSSDDTEKSGEFPSLEEDRHDKDGIEQMDTSMQHCIGEEFQGAELMSDRTLSDTDFGDVSPISFLNCTDGMKFDDKDSSIFSSSIKLQIKHRAPENNKLSDSALTISFGSSVSENGISSSDEDIAEKHDLSDNNREFENSEPLRFNVTRSAHVQFHANPSNSSGSMSVEHCNQVSNEEGGEQFKKKFIIKSSSNVRNVNIHRERVISFLDTSTVYGMNGDTLNASSESTEITSNNTSANCSDTEFLARRDVSCFLGDVPQHDACNIPSGSSEVNTNDTNAENTLIKYNGPLEKATTDREVIESHQQNEFSLVASKPNNVAIVSNDLEKISSDSNEKESNNELHKIAPNGDHASVNGSGTLDVNEEIGTHTNNNPVVSSCKKTQDFENPNEKSKICPITKPIDKLSSLCAKTIFEHQYSYILCDDLLPCAASSSECDAKSNLINQDASSNAANNMMNRKALGLTSDVNQNVSGKCSLGSLLADQITKMNLPKTVFPNQNLIDVNLQEIHDLMGCSMFEELYLNNVQCDQLDFYPSSNPSNEKGCKELSHNPKPSDDYGYDEDSPYVTKRRPKKKRAKSKVHKESLVENPRSTEQGMIGSGSFSSTMSTSYNTACENISACSEYNRAGSLPQTTPAGWWSNDLSTIGSTPRFTYSALETARANLSLIRRVSTSRSINSSFDLSDTSPSAQCGHPSTLPHQNHPGQLVFCGGMLACSKCPPWCDPQCAHYAGYSQGVHPPYYCYCKCSDQMVPPVNYSKSKDLPYFCKDGYNSDESDLSGSWCAEDAVPNEYRQDVAGSINRLYSIDSPCGIHQTPVDVNSDSAVGEEKDPDSGSSMAVRSPSKCPFDYESPDLTNLFVDSQDLTRHDSPDSGYRADAENTIMNTHLLTPIGFDSLTPSPGSMRRLSTIDQFLLLEKACDIVPTPSGPPIPSPQGSPDHSRSLYTIFESSENTQ